MASVTVTFPEKFEIGVMKKAGLPPVAIDPSKCSNDALVNSVIQGMKYLFDARLSHKAKATGEAAESPQESVEAVKTRLYAPVWIVRQRGETAEEELSLEDRAYLMACEPRFQKAGVVWRANKKMGKEARTVLDVVDELGGTAENAWEIAAKAVAGDYLTKQGMDADKIPAAVEGSWKKIQQEAKDHLKSLKSRAAAEF
jgi:hypothetical protein